MKKLLAYSKGRRKNPERAIIPMFIAHSKFADLPRLFCFWNGTQLRLSRVNNGKEDETGVGSRKIMRWGQKGFAITIPPAVRGELLRDRWTIWTNNGDLFIQQGHLVPKVA